MSGEFTVSHVGWHAEFLFRRISDTKVEYFDQDGTWVDLREAGFDNPLSPILQGYARRFYGPLQTEKFMPHNPNVEYVVYSMDINPRR